jgi:hypothetical protein
MRPTPNTDISRLTLRPAHLTWTWNLATLESAADNDNRAQRTNETAYREQQRSVTTTASSRLTVAPSWTWTLP